MELERDWPKFCTTLHYIKHLISAKERSQQCKLVENWEIGSEPQKIEESAFAHLDTTEKQQLMNLHDRYSKCFSDVPVLCNIVCPEVPLLAIFKPKRLIAYRNKSMQKLIDKL